MTKKFLTIILMTILTVSVFAQGNETTEDTNKNRALTEKEIKFKEKVLDKKPEEVPPEIVSNERYTGCIFFSM